MPFGRIFNDRDITMELHNDEESDVELDVDDVDNNIQEMIEDYNQLLSEVDGEGVSCEPDVEEPEELEPQVICPSRSRGRSTGDRQIATRGRCRGRRGRVSQLAGEELRMLDEANGWTYEVRQQARPDDPVFQDAVGVQAPVDGSASCLDCYKLFMTSEVIKLIKKETNRYAAQMKATLVRRGQMKPNSFLATWTPVTETELSKFFAIIIHMSLVRKETMDSYWSTNLFISTPFPRVAMSRNRFRAIYSCLHLNDNTNYIPRGEPQYDAFFKLRPYFDMLVKQCKNYLLPTKNLTIDEGTCGFRGRVHFRVFNKDKPDKYGMKIYMLCEAETGYALKMVPYVGDSKTVQQIVMELMEGYLHKWHTVYMDRFFTSPTIVDLLWLQETRAVGTVMLNRKGLPKAWCQQALDINEMSFCHRGPLTATKWKDKRDVPLLSTKHVAEWTEVDVKAKGGLTKRVKPNCVLDYNINKVGVDLNDQYVSYYAHNRKSMKWWKKMFFHLFARATVNAFIIYKKTRPAEERTIHFATFLERSGQALAEQAGVDEQAASGPSRCGPQGDGGRLLGRHFIAPIPPTPAKEKPYKVCKVCADIGKARTGVRGRKETAYQCEDCQTPLCIHPCFKKYHTLVNYTS